MVCREAVKKGDELLRVPIDMAFSDDPANLADWPWVSTLDLPGIARLAIVVMRERVAPSTAVHRRHLEPFPQAVDSSLSWSDEEVALLEDTSWHTVAKEAREIAQEEFEKIEQAAPREHLDAMEWSRERWLWAKHCSCKKHLSARMDSLLTLIGLSSVPTIQSM